MSPRSVVPGVGFSPKTPSGIENSKSPAESLFVEVAAVPFVSCRYWLTSSTSSNFKVRSGDSNDALFLGPVVATGRYSTATGWPLTNETSRRMSPGAADLRCGSALGLVASIRSRAPPVLNRFWK